MAQHHSVHGNSSVHASRAPGFVEGPRLSVLHTHTGHETTSNERGHVMRHYIVSTSATSKTVQRKSQHEGYKRRPSAPAMNRWKADCGVAPAAPTSTILFPIIPCVAIIVTVG